MFPIMYNFIKLLLEYLMIQVDDKKSGGIKVQRLFFVRIWTDKDKQSYKNENVRMIISSGILYMARFRRTVLRPRSALLSKLLLPQRIPMCRNELACLYSEYNVLVYNLLRLAEASAIVPHSVIKIILSNLTIQINRRNNIMKLSSN